MKRFLIFLLSGFILWTGCTRQPENYQAILPSPEFDIHLYFNLFNGHPYYMVYHYDQKIFDWSALGFTPDHGALFNEKMSLVDNHSNISASIEGKGQGENYFSNRQFNALTIHLQSAEDKSVDYFLDFRTFKGGMAFRYRFENDELMTRLLKFESSGFVLDGPNQHQHGDSSVNASTIMKLPLELMSDQNYRISILESDVVPGTMYLEKLDGNEPAYISKIVTDQSAEPWDQLATPWRIILISKNELNE